MAAHVKARGTQLVQDEEGALPIPLTVDGASVPARGRTVVRWVYPLEPTPPGYVPDADGSGI